jgi:hypothetical protein
MVDVLRKHGPALEWLATLDSERLGIPGLVAMELLQGCRNRAEQRRVESLLRPYRLYWPTEMDCMRAYGDFSAHHLSTGIGLLDALIAEIAVGLSVKLSTFNGGHYRAIAALEVLRPYER